MVHFYLTILTGPLEMKHTIAFMRVEEGEGKVEGNKGINKIKQGIKEDGREGKSKESERKTQTGHSSFPIVLCSRLHFLQVNVAGQHSSCNGCAQAVTGGLWKNFNL